MSSEEQFKDMGKALLGVFTTTFDLTSTAMSAVTGIIDRKREAAEAKALRERLSAGLDTGELETALARKIHNANFPTLDQFTEAFYARLLDAYKKAGQRLPNVEIRGTLLSIAVRYYDIEKFAKPPNAMADVLKGAIEAARYRDQLLAQQAKIADPLRAITVFSDCLIRSFLNFSKFLPPLALDAPNQEYDAPESTPTIPLIDLLTDKACIRALYEPLFNPEAIEIGLFKVMRDVIDVHLEGQTPERMKGEMQEIVDTLFSHTLLQEIFEAGIPFTVPLRSRLEHTVIVGGSGAGKTMLMKNIIYDDLNQDDPPAIIVIDSTGAMIRTIQQLAAFTPGQGHLADRLIIIDPEDDRAPGLNMFSTNNVRLKGYSRNVQEQIEAEVIQLFNYVFGTVARELTGRQSGIFSYIVKLMLARTDANIETLRDLLEEKATYETSKYRQTIDTLDLNAQSFFKNQFFEKTFFGTRKQIAERLYALLQVPAFLRMFTSTNSLDLYQAMQDGKIVLVNTSINLLKEEASAVFGRFILAKALGAAFERVAIAPDQRRPCFIFVDEANPYTDDNIETILTKVRQYKVGIVLAYQHLEQVSDKVFSAISSSTSVKYASTLGFADRRTMAREMETTEQFIAAQKTDSSEPPKWGHFACYVRNYTDTAVSLKVPFATMEECPKMSAESLALLKQLNTEKVAAPLALPAPSATAPAPHAQSPTPIQANPSPKSTAPDPGEPSDDY